MQKQIDELFAKTQKNIEEAKTKNDNTMFSWWMGFQGALILWQKAIEDVNIKCDNCDKPAIWHQCNIHSHQTQP